MSGAGLRRRRSLRGRLLWALAAAPLIGGVANPSGLAVKAFEVHRVESATHGWAGESSQRVIVFLKPASLAQRAVRRDVGIGTGLAVPRGLSRISTSRIEPLRLIHAVVATVSGRSLKQLRRLPGVEAVIPDFTVHLPSLPVAEVPRRGARRHQPPTRLRACSGQQPLLEPEALQLTSTAFADPATPQAQSIVTGKGVTVAFLADGLDPNNPDFIRKSGGHVFMSYQDFSGDGPNSPAGGGEAFGDASSIAAQGNQTYDLNRFVDAHFRASMPCRIRVRGMAPGASLMGLKVFGFDQTSYASSIVAAIQYAVNHGANVISESFGFYHFPDNGLDPISIANDAAVRAGVTVVASSGDSGSGGTVAAPASDPNVIATGASTQFQAYEQTGFGGSVLGTGGYLDDNVSALSSAGVTDMGTKSVDVLAPGDLGWALCDPTHRFLDCSSFGGAPSPVELFGGTSESAPLTAGEAALVIEAYRRSHQGTSPTPAEVREIILSSATDLGEPGYEQGAGLINSLRAVQMAESYENRAGASGTGLAVSPGSLSATLPVRRGRTFDVLLRNTGATTTSVHPRFLTVGPQIDPQTFLVKMVGGLPQFQTEDGGSGFYATRSFSVPAGATRLDATMAWDSLSSGEGAVALTLFDPSGNMAAYSMPQGLGSFAHVDVRTPRPGEWRAIVWTRDDEPTFRGDVRLDVWSSDMVSAGAVRPASVTIAPGATAKVAVSVTGQTDAGDFSGQVTFTDAAGAALAGAVPVYVRTLVPVTGTGMFSGELTGGNGRQVAGSKVVAFSVPRDRPALSVGINLSQPDPVDGLLIAPNGYAADVETSVQGTSQSISISSALNLFALRPMPGTWRIILLASQQRTSPFISLGFRGTIGFTAPSVRFRRVPRSSRFTLRPGHVHRATITIRNDGNAVRAYFVDARTARETTSSPPATVFDTLPEDGFLSFTVPTETTAVRVVAAALNPIVPIENELSTWTNSPDLIGSASSGRPFGIQPIVDGVQGHNLPAGTWLSTTGQIGPFAQSLGRVTSYIQVFLRYHAFDSAVTTGRGDLWPRLMGLESLRKFRPVWLYPGQTAKLTVRFRAGRARGIDRGTLFVDSVSFARREQLLPTGIEIAAARYAFRVPGRP